MHAVTAYLWMKRVLAHLDDDTARFLKMYAATWEMSQSDVITEALKQTMHQHAVCCIKAEACRTSADVPNEKRELKQCWGYPCRTCAHDARCRVGLYKGNWEIANRYKYLLTGKECPLSENEGTTI